jgi:hypothetical protein
MGRWRARLHGGDRGVNDLFKDTGGIANLAGTAKHGSYAYFPGTGPDKKTCADCEFYLGGGVDPQDITKTGFCDRFKEITGKKGHRISMSSPACREFEVRKRPIPKGSKYKPLR